MMTHPAVVETGKYQLVTCMSSPNLFSVGIEWVQTPQLSPRPTEGISNTMARPPNLIHMSSGRSMELGESDCACASAVATLIESKAKSSFPHCLYC